MPVINNNAARRFQLPGLEHQTLAAYAGEALTLEALHPHRRDHIAGRWACLWDSI